MLTSNLVAKVYKQESNLELGQVWNLNEFESCFITDLSQNLKIGVPMRC